MEVTFNKIHEVVIEALGLKIQDSVIFEKLCAEIEDTSILEIIGKWYFDFLKSSEEKLIIHIPKYEEESISVAFNYAILFSLTYRLISRPELIFFENTCLINVFDFDKKNVFFSNQTKSTFDFVKQEGDLLHWSDNVLISKNRFIPVFIKDQLENSNWVISYNTFKLFKIIENKGLINHPVLINFREDLCLSLYSGERISAKEVIQTKTLNWDAKKYSQEDAIKFEDELLSQDFTNQISIKYPYHKNIHTYLLGIGIKRLSLIFNNRFYYQNITDDGINLLPKELSGDENVVIDFSTKFTIFDTNHSLSIFTALHEFRSAWQVYEFNKFTTPFPKYWFLFINQSIEKDEWFEMFKTDYPSLSERPIISSIKIIIDLLYDLNWSKSYFERAKNPVLLLPEIKGFKRKKLEKSLNSFRNYLLSINSNIFFIENDEDYDYNQYSDLLVLDCFNVINLVNIFQKNEDLKILIPDFLYFNYQPWIKYQLLNYQFDALLNLKRELFDSNFIKNKESFINQRSELIKSIKLDILKYQTRYNVLEDIIEIEENLSMSEDIVFRNEEELEISLDSQINIIDTELLIETTEGMLFQFKSSNQVLIQRSSVVLCPALQLKTGDFFILMSEINSIIDKDSIINKLSRIPETVVKFQVELGKKVSAYQTLENHGIVYKNEKYFNDKYVLSNEDYVTEKFILPKRKDNWRIICEYLGISKIDLNQAWISYYGRRHINEIKEIYKHILNLCIDGQYLSEIENPKLIIKITEFLEEKNEIFEEGEGTNAFELAKSIVSAIINELSFHQVKEIIKI
jgi:aspartate carbamoyltransferase regulatory subunit